MGMCLKNVSKINTFLAHILDTSFRHIPIRRIPQDDYKKLLPLKKIAEASSYSFGYVSILVQRKKLKARKIGNKYYSTKEWFDQYLEYHGREGKKLPPEAVEELNTIFPTPISAGAEEPPSNPLLEGGQNFRRAARARSQDR